MKAIQLLKRFGIAALFCLSSMVVQAQQVVVENGVEYLADGVEEQDANSLDLKMVAQKNKEQQANIKKRKKRAKQRLTKKEATALLENGTLRFRKKRASNKCFQKAKEKCKPVETEK
ncbi:exported hypothetical protein [Tenacibaculum litopenaei]|jgi:hypothetical protein|uniref:hypothetical protein n=1 Tax=Tenacibaculum litopenaei TaxID=396016 RepID=UPI003894EF4B